MRWKAGDLVSEYKTDLMHEIWYVIKVKVRHYHVHTRNGDVSAIQPFYQDFLNNTLLTDIFRPYESEVQELNEYKPQSG